MPPDQSCTGILPVGLHCPEIGLGEDRGVRTLDWGEQTIEVKETAEKAVVGKTARVVEEVDVRKVGSERVETVRDKVRRQEIEIEHAGEQASKTPARKPSQKKK